MTAVNWGVIGAGGIADRRTIPAMMTADNARLVAVMDIDEGIVRRVKTKYGVPKGYTDALALLEDDEVTAVYIASPVKFHREQAVQAASLGKHILLEKPMAMSVEEGEGIVQACRTHGVLLATGFMMRFGSRHRKIRDMVASAKIGPIVSARVQLSCWYPDMENSWRQDPDLGGGGSLMDLGIHCLDLLEFLLGDDIVEICAFLGTNTFQYKVEDSAALLCRMRGGATAYIDAHFNIPDRATEQRLEVYGTKGSILASGTLGQVDTGVVRLITLPEEEVEYDAQQDGQVPQFQEVAVEPVNMYERQIESFSDAVLNGPSGEMCGELGMRAQRLCAAAYEAARTGQVVRVDDV